ncbi:MAG: AAA family ATPase [Clostridiales bacterium]|nr:AAA family ATPase [Clostridiales bacterium]
MAKTKGGSPSKESSPFSDIYGNSELVSFISLRIEAGDLAHAYILEGPDGSGKTLLAVSAAAALAGGKFASKVKRMVSPDVVIFAPQPGHKSITVDEIRALKSDAAMTPNELDCRVFIFDEAQDMSTASQNTLLKLLEEPPRNIYFFLLCTSASGLLPTVRSRAPVLRMELFSDEELRDYLLENVKKSRNFSPDDLDVAVRAARGTIGGAIKSLSSRAVTAESGDRALASDLISISARLCSSSRPTKLKAELFSLAARLPSDRLELAEILSLSEFALRDLIAAKVNPDIDSSALLFYRTPEEPKEASEETPLANLSEMFSIIDGTITELAMNVNVYTTQISMLYRLSRIG